MQVTNHVPSSAPVCRQASPAATTQCGGGAPRNENKMNAETLQPAATKKRLSEAKCPSCDGPLVAIEGRIGNKFGIYLTCMETINGPENCPDATGICSTIEEALSYLDPDTKVKGAAA